MIGPYGEAAWTYRAAGWAGVLPLPPASKWPPPSGWTGWAGADPSGADVQAWVDGGEGAGNIALRLPHGTYGLDVDDYGGKSGGAALAALVDAHGPLPATWIVGSRTESVSGIRVFRAALPPGRRWIDEPGGHGAGIEAVHYGHRYAVTWPSIHPEGRKYVWRRPDQALAGDGEVPRLNELPALPDAWVAALSAEGEARTGEQAGHAETLAAVHAWPEGEPCTRMREAQVRATGRLRLAVDGAALHPAGRDGTHELASLGHEGHAGARAALAAHYGLFVDARAGREGGTSGARGKAESEWWRLVRGAVGKLYGPPRASCTCALLAGEGLSFEYDFGGREVSSAGDDSTPGGEGGVGGLVGPLASRLMTPAQVRILPPPAMVIDGLLTMDSESWMISAPGAGKTFVALDMAAHVAAGRPWMGRDVREGPVLYLLAEGVGGLGKRVRAWEQRNGPMSTDMHFLTTAVQAGQPDQWAALVDLAAQLRPVLVVLDTQARLTVGIKENDNTAMGEWVHAVGQLRRASSGCVLVVHHTGRGGGDARGASAIDGAQDSELKLTRTAGRRVALSVDKQRHLPDDARVELELFECALDDGSTSLVVGPPLTSTAPVAPWREGLTDNEMMIMDILRDLYSERGGSRPDVRTALRERGQRGEVRYVKSTFDYAWNSLLKKDRIERIDGTERFVPAEVSAVPDGSGH